MSTKAGPLENTPISNWLAELHMECYKKNLENFDTIRPLLDFKETELKKLGIMNSKDRATMMGSLANYKTVRKDLRPSAIVIPLESGSRSLLRKGSLKKLKFKGLLGSGGNKKGKRKPDSAVISTPNFSTAFEVGDGVPLSPVSPSQAHPRSYTVSGRVGEPGTISSHVPIPDYEELPEIGSPKHFHVQVVGRKAIENEYVPSPNNSPRLDAFRLRSNTIGDPMSPVSYPSDSDTVTPRHLNEFTYIPDSPMSGASSSTGGGVGGGGNGSGLLRNKHLSVISMESGLSFGYDIDKDFNPALPLDNQPWFHGRIPRGESESLLHDDGDFLVRENVTMKDTFTLSMHWRGGFDHTLVSTTEVVSNRNGRGIAVKYHFDDGGAFDSIPELIYSHLKYQIPIDKDNLNVITNPVCKMGVGSKLPSAPAPLPVGYTPPTHHPLPPPFAQALSDLSPTSYNSVTLPRNFGSNRQKLRTYSPEKEKGHSNRSSPFSPHESPRSSPLREHSPLKSSNSSGDLLDDRKVKTKVHVPRSAMSPPPQLDGRMRAMTESHHLHRGGHQDGPHRHSFLEDYEHMDSVSILETSPSLGRKSFSSTTTSSVESSPSLGWEPVQYAELRCHQRGSPAPSGNGKRHSRAVKYAEVRFSRLQESGSSPAPAPHPFSLYDTIPKASPKKSNPYQSRAELLAQKLQADYATPMRVQPQATTGNNLESRIPRVDSSPHPFSHYASIQTFPRQTSTPTVVVSAGVPVSTYTTTPATVRGDSLNVTYAQLCRSRTPHSDEESGHSSPGLVISTKVLRGLPGYDALVRLHSLLGNYSNEDLAFHLTKADAVCFLIAPRAGEHLDVWRDRVHKMTSASGLYVGLQTLADPDGEKLWKKLYYRHQGISQLVSLCIVSAGDAVERAKVLRRFIDVASLLQGETLRNIFSFVSIMQGIAAPQVSSMSTVWEVLSSQYPETASRHRELQNVVSSLMNGVSVFPAGEVSVPVIQHLKTVFYYEDPTLPGYGPPIEDRSLLGEYSSLLIGLDGIHTILANTSQYCYNAWKRFGSYRYDATLMDFFLQDYSRSYLQHMGVSADDAVERRRRFGVLLDALADRVDSLENL